MSSSTLNNLSSLPPELLDHIVTYLPTAQSLANLSITNESLRALSEKDAWRTFYRTRFPSIYAASPQSHKEAVRSLTGLSKAWDRRAVVARYIEPQGDIRAYPGDQKVERWKRPRGQTIGFTPYLSVVEDIGPRWRDRQETLAFSAGAEICVRHKVTDGEDERQRWTMYRPHSAYEGRDDVTTLHLVRSSDPSAESGAQQVVIGTANGDLQLVRLPTDGGADVRKTYFTTQGMPVRSSSVLERSGAATLLVASMGDSRIALYPVDAAEPKIGALSQIDIRPAQTEGAQRKHQRVWSTTFLSSDYLAAGIGPSDEPIQVHALTPAGIDPKPLRKFSLQNDLDKLAGEITLSGFAKKSTSSIYPVVPLPAASTVGGPANGTVFLSGAYDGIIRLHDLRSTREVEQAYIDPTDDSAIYSLLPRGQEKLVAGTSRHSLLKVFDMRLGAKCYDYRDANTASRQQRFPTSSSRDWNLFLKPTSNSQSNRGWSRNRSAESSVYSLSSPSPHSPYLYAGVENAVVELAFTGVLDRHPDPVFFAPWQPAKRGIDPSKGSADDNWRSREVLDLAMYDQTPDMKLFTQKSLWETWRSRQSPVAHTLEFPKTEGLDERWRVGSG